MKITADTNVLVRVLVKDGLRQTRLAAKTLANASLVVITLPCLCEVVWVLRSSYGFSNSEISTAISALNSVQNVVLDRVAVEAGIAILDAGGDFADGIIAGQGRWLGGTNLVSFDRKAVALLKEQGHVAQLLKAAK